MQNVWRILARTLDCAYESIGPFDYDTRGKGGRYVAYVARDRLSRRNAVPVTFSYSSLTSAQTIHSWVMWTANLALRPPAWL